MATDPGSDTRPAAPASKVEAALAWAARGFRVFPLRENGKRPVWEGWTETATNDPGTIRSWWEGTDYNIGVLTTGLLGVDLDMKDGRNGLAAWRALGGPEDTLTVRTPSGGLHLYFWGADVRLSAGALGAGVDIRSHNGYLVAPGSTIDGVPYQVIQDVPMQRAPAAIVARCQAPAPPRSEAASVPLTDLDTPAAIERARDIISHTPGAERGQQSDAAFRLAARVKDEGVSEIMCAVLMMEWAGRCNPPIGAADIEHRVENAYRYGQNRPGAKAPEVQFSGVNIPPPPEPTPPPPAAPAEARRSKLRMLSVEECCEAPPRGYVVKGLLAPGQVGCIFGQPGAGKSVLAPHLAYRVAQGRLVFGHRTKQGAVFYVAAEDEAGMRQRVNALRLRNGDAPGLYLIAGVSALVAAGEASTPDLAELLARAEERRPVLIVVDTLAAASSGLDENSSQDMSRIAKAMRSLTRFGAAVLLVETSAKRLAERAMC